MEHKHESNNTGSMKFKANIALIIFLLIGAYFLVTEHRAHLAGWMSYWWPYVFLLACPLIHLFMHGGHGHGHGGHGSSDGSNERNKEKDNGSHH